ncbi:phosphotransferase [uncultured Kriegella sp.]|uniref:phosphotransferase n=1 Tax=uncultured Kriegella sp. TaxID=1798910 RepID=UPI0030DB72D1|tara:strand:- start:172990 stop:173982 length:993 start_codon:yes stop_codon:yes gene_type:complete
MKKLSKDLVDLQNYLRQQGWLKPHEQIASVAVPGEGNMNFTLRIDTGQETFIIKQSRDYVEKYPQVAAPQERVLREAEFYELIKTEPLLNRMMPTIIGLDKANSVMAMEDLGTGSDYTYLYKKGNTIDEQELFDIITFVATLHRSFDSNSVASPLQNRKMRALNHEHIFLYPYLSNNGLDLDQILPGLKKIGTSFSKDAVLKSKVEQLGKDYLADGNTLLHGDYFPGSWLKTANGIKIIDPEFCFFGFPEFEMGVTIAHLKMADQPQKLIDNALVHYQTLAKLDNDLCAKFTAIEIIRRLLGLAQLPLEINLTKRRELLEISRECLLRNP